MNPEHPLPLPAQAQSNPVQREQTERASHLRSLAVRNGASGIEGRRSSLGMWDSHEWREDRRNTLTFVGLRHHGLARWIRGLSGQNRRVLWGTAL